MKKEGDKIWLLKKLKGDMLRGLPYLTPIVSFQPFRYRILLPLKSAATFYLINKEKINALLNKLEKKPDYNITRGDIRGLYKKMNVTGALESIQLQNLKFNNHENKESMKKLTNLSLPWVVIDVPSFRYARRFFWLSVIGLSVVLVGGCYGIVHKFFIKPKQNKKAILAQKKKKTEQEETPALKK